MRINLIVLLLVVSWNVNGQLSMYNSSLTDTTQHIVYVGFDNQIILVGNHEEEVMLVSSNGDTLGYADGIFHFKRPQRNSDTLTIISEGKTIGTQVFESKVINPPRILLENLNEEEVTVEQLSSNPGLIVTFAPQLLKSNFKVVGFKGYIQYGAGEKFVIDYSGDSFRSKFEEKELSAIEKMTSGDVLHIEGVDVTCPGCVITWIDTPKLKYTIK